MRKKSTDAATTVIAASRSVAEKKSFYCRDSGYLWGLQAGQMLCILCDINV